MYGNKPSAGVLRCNNYVMVVACACLVIISGTEYSAMSCRPKCSGMLLYRWTAEAMNRLKRGSVSSQLYFLRVGLLQRNIWLSAHNAKGTM